MKKQGISALLVLLLLLLIPATASADVIYPAPGELVVGVEVDHLLATLDPEGSFWTDPALLPEGLHVDTVESEEGIQVYLRGVPTTPGSYDLVFNYSGTDSICTINVIEQNIPEPTLQSVSVETLPEKTEYEAGDVLDATGLSIRVQLSNGESYVVTEGFALYPTRLEDAGTRSIEVNYEGLLCYFQVEVAEPPEVIEGIGVLSLPVKVVYDVGDVLDASGLGVRVYTNHGTRDVYTDLLCLPTLLDTPGQQMITVYYGEKICTFSVQVLEEEAPASIAVYRLPSKLDYQLGEALDTSGLVLIETSNRDNPSYLETGYACSPTQLEETGQQEITVSVGELHCSYYVTVRDELPVTPAQQPEKSEPIQIPVVPAAPTVMPQPELIPDRTEGGAAQSGRLLAVAIVGAALLALLVLAGYLLFINREERRYFADSVKDLFRRR